MGFVDGQGIIGNPPATTDGRQSPGGTPREALSSYTAAFRYGVEMNAVGAGGVGGMGKEGKATQTGVQPEEVYPPLFSISRCILLADCGLGEFP